MTDSDEFIDGLFAQHGTSMPNRVAIVSEDGVWTIADVRREIEHTAQRLRARGFAAGHRIAVSLPAGRAALATILGALCSGGIVAPLSRSLGPAARCFRLQELQPDIIVDEDGGRNGDFAIVGRAASTPDVGCLVLWTSGSTGLPKGVVLDWRGVLWNARANACELDIRPTDRALILLDPTYCYAFVHQILSHWIVGGSVAMPPQPVWLEATGRLVERFEPTTLAVVPSILRTLLALPRLHAPLGRLRLLTVGGAAVDEALLRRAQETLPEVKLVVTYGLTEAGPRVATRFVRRHEDLPAGTVGRVLPGVDLWVDTEGQIFVRSPSVRVGVLEKGRIRLAPAWVATGDLGELGSNGTLRLIGRRRPMINRGGVKIAPGEIERVLCSDPNVVAARVVAMPHARLGEVPKALVVPRPYAVPTISSLACRCFEQLGAAWVPVAFEFMQSLPPAPSGWKEVT